MYCDYLSRCCDKWSVKTIRSGLCINCEWMGALGVLMLLKCVTNTNNHIWKMHELICMKCIRMTANCICHEHVTIMGLQQQLKQPLHRPMWITIAAAFSVNAAKEKKIVKYRPFSNDKRLAIHSKMRKSLFKAINFSKLNFPKMNEIDIGSRPNGNNRMQ